MQSIPILAAEDTLPLLIPGGEPIAGEMLALHPPAKFSVLFGEARAALKVQVPAQIQESAIQESGPTDGGAQTLVPEGNILPILMALIAANKGDACITSSSASERPFGGGPASVGAEGRKPERSILVALTSPGHGSGAVKVSPSLGQEQEAEGNRLIHASSLPIDGNGPSEGARGGDNAMVAAALPGQSAQSREGQLAQPNQGLPEVQFVFPASLKIAGVPVDAKHASSSPAPTTMQEGGWATYSRQDGIEITRQSQEDGGSIERTMLQPAEKLPAAAVPHSFAHLSAGLTANGHGSTGRYTGDTGNLAEQVLLFGRGAEAMRIRFLPSTGPIKSIDIDAGDRDPKTGHRTGGETFGLPLPVSASGAIRGVGDAGLAQASASLPSTPPDPVDQIVAQAYLFATDKGMGVRLKLQPPELGAVHIRLVVESGHVTLRLTAETDVAKRLIESSWPKLQTGLAEHGLRVERIVIDAATVGGGQNILYSGSQPDAWTHRSPQPDPRYEMYDFGGSPGASIRSRRADSPYVAEGMSLIDYRI